MTPPPPSPFPSVNRIVLPAGTILHRVHNGTYGADSFNPCQGRPSRFAPLVRPGRPCIPTAYLAQSFECAVHETVFHDIPHDAARKTLDVDAIRSLRYAAVATRADVVLAALFEPDLNRWGLSRRDLIDTFASQYVRTADWAIAIHGAHHDVGGLVWTSRRCDPERAYVFFGNRVGPSVGRIQTSRDIGTDATLMQNVIDFGRRAGITVIV